MQAVAAELSGYAGKCRCLFGEKGLKTVCFDSLILKQRASIAIILVAIDSVIEYRYPPGDQRKPHLCD
jgi:hypothetical protein